MPNNIAVIIGINNYEFLPPLRCAKCDAEALHKRLSADNRFTRIFLFTDDSPKIPGVRSTRPFRSNLLRFLNQLSEKYPIGKQDDLWFFFSGHGIRRDSCDYLIPQDGDPDNIEDTAISMHKVTDALERCGSDNIILILDACRNQGRKSAEMYGSDTADLARQKGIIGYFSCSPEQYSYEFEELQNGLFTTALLHGLGEEGKCATVEKLNKYLRRKVSTLIETYSKGTQQTPYTIAEPVEKMHLVLMPQYASTQDINSLRLDAFRAEDSGDWEIADQLWREILIMSSGTDEEAIQGIQKAAINIKKYHKVALELSSQTPENDKTNLVESSADEQTNKDKSSQYEGICKSRFSIGIYLGIYQSVICFCQGRTVNPIPDSSSRSFVVPSIVAINQRGELLVGENARGYVDKKGKGIREVLRIMGSSEKVVLNDKEYRPEEISALILRKVKENAEEALSEEIRDAVISVPANFKDAQRQATRNAAELAGLKVLRLINEPEAVSLAFGIDRLPVEEALIVFNWDSFLDISVFKMNSGILDIEGTYGDPLLGETDLVEALICLALKKFQFQYRDITISQKASSQLREATEHVVRDVLPTQSYLSSYSFTIPDFAVQEGELIDFEVEITRDEFNQVIAPLVDSAKECVNQALKAIGIEPHSVSRALLLGSMTRITEVQDLLEDTFSRILVSAVDPSVAIGMGAAISAAIVQNCISESHNIVGKGSDIVLADVVPFGLGIELIHRFNHQVMRVYDPIIERNTAIPNLKTKEYTLMSPEQTQVEFELYQFHVDGAKFPEDVCEIGLGGVITDNPPAQAGQAPYVIQIEAGYNSNGVAVVKAFVPKLNKELKVVYGSPKLQLEKELEAWRRTAEARQYESIIDRAESQLERFSNSEQSQLITAIEKLKLALIEGELHAIELAGDELVDLLFDIEDRM